MLINIYVLLFSNKVSLSRIKRAKRVEESEEEVEDQGEQEKTESLEDKKEEDAIDEAAGRYHKKGRIKIIHKRGK
ncbi:hypothetical protein Csa_015400 [Cucumis sativus]|uniref:Uncharacterized protein n=1 Tax=Cucumis sativus TaxID=3659 RepID=A0A0A0KY87_CUCSA|nr:hypothetical protein Csa_015400 [Cucumis sativus]